MPDHQHQHGLLGDGPPRRRGDATSCSMREASPCDMASLPAHGRRRAAAPALPPAPARLLGLVLVFLLRRHRRMLAVTTRPR